MSFLDYLFGAAEIPARQEINASYMELASPVADSSHLESMVMQDLFGVSYDSTTVTINRKTAMSIPAIAKGRNIIATSIARMPLVAEKNNRPLATQPAFLTQLQTGTPNFTTVSWIVDGMIFYGRAFLLITERAANGTPKTFRFVPEYEAETKDGVLVKAFGNKVTPGTYVRIDAHHEGLLNYAGELIRDVKELERTAAEVGANPNPSLVLKVKNGASDESVAALKSTWTGSRRKRYGSVGVINESVDVQSIGQASENLLIEGRNYQVVQVGRAMGIPAYFLDGSVAGASLTYTNVSGKNRQLIDEALAPYMISIEQTLSLYLPTGTSVEFDTSALLRGDTKERYDAYAVALGAGFFTINEVRELENLEPLPEPTPTPTTEQAPA